MGLEIDLNLDGVDPEALERGNALPAGWYPAIVEDVHPDAKSEGTVVFEFRIDGGDYDGIKVFDRLYDPQQAKDTDSAKTLDNRRVIYAKRLGLISRASADPADKRYVLNAARCPGGRLDLEAAIGAEVVLKMTQRNIKDENTGKWVKKERAEIDFAGVYPRDHKDVPEAIRTKNPAATTTTPPPTPPAAPSGAYAGAGTPAAPGGKDPLAGL